MSQTSSKKSFGFYIVLLAAVAALAAGEFLRLGADTGETGPIVIASGDNGFLHAKLSFLMPILY